MPLGGSALELNSLAKLFDFGVNDQIRGVAQRLAAAGFTALVPDLHEYGPIAREECFQI
jgi:hypothetical protein